MNKTSTIYVTGHRGLVGSAICRELARQGFTNVWTTPHTATDLTIREDVLFFFAECRPEYVFHCAAKVGGIADNIAAPADFMVSNLQIDTNVLSAAHRFGVKKLLSVSSAAVYPMLQQEFLSPSDLMTGPMDETKAGYATAKLATLQMCKSFRAQYGSNFISVIPNNVYGPGDKSSHVIPDLLRRAKAAKESGSPLVCWGTGDARREFIFADDLARACRFLMDTYNDGVPVNVGPGFDVSMKRLVELIQCVTDFTGEVRWDVTKPEGAPRRLLNTGALRRMGWTHKTPLLTGLTKTYQAL